VNASQVFMCGGHLSRANRPSPLIPASSFNIIYPRGRFFVHLLETLIDLHAQRVLGKISATESFRSLKMPVTGDCPNGVCRRADR
jgi:hypothetical protein